MATQIHNLDEGISEYFEFILFGKKYRFRYMTSEEIEELRNIGDDGNKTQEYFYKFVSAIDDDAPKIQDVSKKMTVPHLLAFQKMIKQEFGLTDEVSS